ncbi:MAG TPA: winged helix DNA-binding domain-containing protein [Gaiellaceae bacterium]|jgi:hypothetical protein
MTVILDRRTLNRSLFARQLLLERAAVDPADVVERLVGMQAQVPLDPYVGLWSRVDGFDPVAFGEELVERRLVRMTLMRTTLHLVSARDALGIRPVLQSAIERSFGGSPFARQLAGLALEPVVARGVELVEGEPLSVAQLGKALAESWPEREPSALAYAVRYLVPLVQVTPRGVWGKALQPKVTTLDAWLGSTRASSMSAGDLFLRYLRAFGPATLADFTSWSGLTGARTLVGELEAELRTFRDEAGRDLYDIRDGVICDPSTPVPVRFLPQFDNVFLAHADRSRLIDEVRWDASFTHFGTLFVDGFLAGTWKLTDPKRDAALEVELRRRVSTPMQKEIRQEAEALVVFLTPEARTRRLAVG